MPATEIERSLYAAYLTKWEGKLPNEKQFEEWKREQISLYERAATVSEQIAAILENKELSEEDKRTKIEEILRKDPEAGEKFLGILDNEQIGTKGSVNAYTTFFTSQGASEEDARIRAISNVVTIKEQGQYLIPLNSISSLDKKASGYVALLSSLELQNIKPTLLIGYYSTVLVQSEQGKVMIDVMQ